MPKRRNPKRPSRDPPSKIECFVPDEILDIIINELYKSPISVGMYACRLSLTCRYLLLHAFGKLKKIYISPNLLSIDPVPLRVYASSMPVSVVVAFDPAFSDDDHGIIARLLHGAKEVEFPPQFHSFMRPDYHGILQNVEILKSEMNLDPDWLEWMMLGLPKPESDDDDDHPKEDQDFAPLPLRSLTVYSCGHHCVATKRVLKRCANLTELKFEYGTALPSLAGLETLTALRQLILNSEYDTIQSLIRPPILPNDENPHGKAQIDYLRDCLPPQLVSMRNVFLERTFRFPLSAIPLVAADTEEAVDKALPTIPLEDAFASLHTLCSSLSDTSVLLERRSKLSSYTVRKLIDLGADPYALAPSNNFESSVYPRMSTCFHTAVMCGDPLVVSTLYSYVDTTKHQEQLDRIRDRDGYTPLHFAADSFESWKACYEWHRKNVPGFQLDDVQNRSSFTPLRSIVLADSPLCTLREILDCVRSCQPEVWLREIQTDLLPELWRYISEIWRESTLSAADGAFVASLFNDEIVNKLNLDHIDKLDILCLTLDYASETLFPKFASQTEDDRILLLLDEIFDRASFAEPGSNWVLSRVDIVLSTLKGIKPSTWVDDIDESAYDPIDSCIKNKQMFALHKLLDFGFTPVHPNSEGKTLRFLSRLFHVFDAQSQLPRKHAANVAQLSPLLQRYLELNRPDLALLVMEGFLGYLCNQLSFWHLYNQTEALSKAVRALEVLGALLFEHSTFKLFLRKASTKEEWSGTILFILLGPSQLPLTLQKRRDLVNTFSEAILKGKCSRFTTKLATGFHFTLFHSAAFCLLERERTAEGVPELIEAALPRLIDFFEKSSLKHITNGGKLAKCLDGVLEDITDLVPPLAQRVVQVLDAKLLEIDEDELDDEEEEEDSDDDGSSSSSFEVYSADEKELDD